MAQSLKVRKNTINCLENLIINQGINLVRKIGKYKKWTEDEIESIIKEFVTDIPPEFQVISETKRGGKKANLRNSERCCGKVASGERCSRSRKKNIKFCGIHQRMANSEKGLVYGYVDDDESESSKKTSSKLTSSKLKSKKTSKTSKKTSKTSKTSNMKKTKKIVVVIECDDDIKLDNDLFMIGESDDDTDDDDDDCLNTVDIVIDGETYMRDIDTDDVYCKNTGDLLGKYNPNTQSIVE